MASPSLLTRDEGERVKDEKEVHPSSVLLQPSNNVLFLNAPRTEADRRAVNDLIPTLAEESFIAVVSTFRVHLGDSVAAEAEAQILDRLKALQARVVIFRVGNLLGAQTRASVWLHRLGFAYPLAPRRLRSCFVNDAELLTAIETTRHAPNSRRLVTLLGPNRPWRDVLRECRPTGVWSACLTGICFLLSLLLVGHVAACVLDLLARWRPSFKAWNFDTLRPKSFAELLALYNPHNFRHVKIVGYNNGVVHFGHRYPGKTIVSTVLCNRIVRSGADVIKADCGATIRKASDFLTTADQEFYVLPNYSYVCLGTAFFVPIHGSAADFTTVAETIVKALLYDPLSDRLILATSDEPAFRDNVYNFASKLLVLRLWIRVKPKAKYFVHQQTVENAGSEQLLDALRDATATNVEIRKTNAGSKNVQISRYFKAPTETPSAVLEVPRDSLGRLWDRLEENALTSFLMHALTRWLAWHVELFFTPEEFATFWNTHQALPLKKIQLRYIRRDGLPHSPFRDRDCVSVDMFMFRWGRKEFEAYLKQTFAIVRSNPGKHSQ
jgi:hypothetical protein